MILCGKKLKIFFLSSLFLGLGIFSALTPVKAAIEVSSITDSGGYITIPEYEGNALLLCGQTWRSDDSKTQFMNGYTQLSGNTMLSKFTSVWGYNGSNIKGSDYRYILNPSEGSLAFSSWADYWGGGEHKCSWITGVSDDPIVATSTSSDLSYTGSAEGNLVVRIGGKYQYNGEDTDTVDEQFYTRYCGDEYCYWGHYGLLNSSSQYTFTADNSDYRGLFEIEAYQEPEPTGTGLSITYQNYQADNKTLYLRGTCNQYGSGQGQMNIYLDSSTSTVNSLDIFAWNNVPGFVSCENDTWATYIRGAVLTGDHTIFIDDSFYHSTSSPNIVSVDQGFIYTPVPVYASTTLLGLTPDELACSTEEWEDTNWWTQLRCGGLSGFYSILNNFQQIINTIIGGFSSTISTMFPINIPVKINESWEESASSTLPTELAFLNMSDANGDVYIGFPKELTGNASDTPLLIWGPGLFTPEGSKGEIFFGKMKVLSKYLLWAMFIIGVIKLSKKLLTKINPASEERPNI